MDQPVNRYLQDAIAAEKSFEKQLRRFAAGSTMAQASDLFQVHADQTREQYELLTARLQTLGGSTSTWKGFLAHASNTTPTAAQIDYEKEERTTQNLVVAFAVENAEVAMYESLRIAAGMAGDTMTASIVERIQTQEQQTAEKIWKLIAPAAERGIAARRKEGGNLQGAVTLFLQDAEAAERNLEDALTGFAKSGDQSDIQSLMNVMSGKARTQHQRLRARLEALGGSSSTGNSSLADLLSVTPPATQAGHDGPEESSQHLMIVYAAAAAEMALYEALQTAAKAAGDPETFKLAQQLQLEESEDHRLAWEKLPEAARTSSRALLSTV